MKPIDQRYYRGQMRPMGDCVAACVASIFEMSLDEVPHFVEIMYQRAARHDLSKEWQFTQQGLMNAWAWSFGVGVGYTYYRTRTGKRIYRKTPLCYHGGYWIAAVMSRDAAVRKASPEASHAVVMLGYEVAHDPNPDSRAVQRPYRYVGELWFEVAHPQIWLQKIDWREIFNMDRMTA